MEADQQFSRFNQQAAVLKAMANPARLWLLYQLADGERCVNELVSNQQLDMSTISRHLAVLRRAGLVVCRKQATWAYYSLSRPCLMQLLQCVEQNKSPSQLVAEMQKNCQSS